VEIKTESIWADNAKLTGHLKQPDFFDVREHPTAKFQSKSIEPTDVANEYTITGDLTLLDATKEIAFPATIVLDGSGLKLESEFKFDRTRFGMTYGEGQINPDVDMTIVVGATPPGHSAQ
ncbi:MAG: YceI family protein, partial [Planctomycetaceae bacterium]